MTKLREFADSGLEHSDEGASQKTVGEMLVKNTETYMRPNVKIHDIQPNMVRYFILLIGQ